MMILLEKLSVMLKITAYTDVVRADVYIVCVPTPVNNEKRT